MKPLHCSGSILLPTVQGASRSLLIPLLIILLFLTTPKLQAIHDTNQNGVSDLWETKYYNGQLASNFTLTADPDGDGWTNAQEATAGTDPASGKGLTGLVRPAITHTPAVYLSPVTPGSPPQLLTPEVATVTWPTLAGKKYTLLFSTDLTAASWTTIGSPRIGVGTAIGTSIPLTQPDGTTPAALFWRVTIADEDTDNDTLTNTEEAELGGNPTLADTDGDGLGDKQETELGTSLTLADTDADGAPDGTEVTGDSNPNNTMSVPPPEPYIASECKSLTATQSYPIDYANGICNSTYSFARYPSTEFSWTPARYNTAPIDPVTCHSEIKNYAYQPISDESYTSPQMWVGLQKVAGYTQELISIPDLVVYHFSLAAESHALEGTVYQGYRIFENRGYNLRLENRWKCPTELTKHFLKIYLKAPSPSGYYQYANPFSGISTTDYTVVEEDTKAVKLTIPKGAKFSQEYELEPPIIETAMCHLVTLLPVEVKAHQDKNGPQRSAPKYNHSPSVGSATNLFSVWPDEEIILKVKMPSPFDQQGNLPANLIKWDVPGHTFADNLLEARMKWGVNFFNSAVNTKAITITIGGSEFKVYVQVQGTGILSQAEGAALVPHAAPIMLAHKFEAENYTNTTFPISPKRDALRHAYWCSLSVSTFPVTASDVPLISTGHERDNRYDGKQQAFNTTMDLKNNDVGTSVRYQVNGLPDKVAIKQALEQLYTAGAMDIWEVPPSAASASQGDSEGIITKSDGTRIH